MKNLFLPILLVLFIYVLPIQAQIRILNFQADNGYQHHSKDEANTLVESLGTKNGWKVISTNRVSDLNKGMLSSIDVLLFNNNCGTDSAIFSHLQQVALKDFIRNGGGFVGIHCAGAILLQIAHF